MDPGVGRVEKWPIDSFRAKWTHVFIILTPALGFVPSKQGGGAWSRLLALLRPQKYVLMQALAGVVLGTVLSLSGAIFVQKIVDNVIVDGNRNLLRLLGVSMLVILAVRTLLGYFQSVLMLRSAQKIDAGLILGYYRHLMRLPQSFFDTMRVGEITARVRDAVAVRDFLNGTILNMIVSPLVLIVALAAMFTYSWRLALFSLALLPANVGIYFASDWLNRRYQREIMERSADFDSQLVESLHAMSVVRSCGMEEEMCFRSETRLVKLLKRIWTATNTGFVIAGAGSIVTQAYSVGLLWIGAGLVLDSQLTAGELMSCSALAGYITGPIVTLLGMNASIRTATTATERLYEILDLERERDEGSAELTLPGTFDLIVERVSFRYPGRVAALTDVSLRFSSGTISALAGKSGCGKSTILGLIQRHYLPESGKIFVNQSDIQYIKLAALRAKIAYVPQRIDLLAGTVLENIAPNEGQPDMQRIGELCRRVGILEFVENLPRGFQTLITENGANLSGGQKQRLAVVRALYADAPIVLMDEPSSALDQESEDMLTSTLEAMRKDGKLIILAVHNRRLLAMCDQVIELDSGKVIAVHPQDRCLPAIEARGLAITSTLAVPATIADEPYNRDLSFRKTGRSGINDYSKEQITGLADQALTDQAKALYYNLRERSCGGTLLGQTDTNVMGVREDGRGWFMEEGRCDILAVTDKRPAVYGFHIGSLAHGWAVECGYMVPKIREAYSYNGLVTVSWHPENLVTGESCRTGCAVSDILPGACRHKELCARLDIIADNLGNLTDVHGRSIPIIFRCWHEQNGDHFWWGRSRCTKEEFLRLFRFTVSYFRERRRVKNFLYSFSVSVMNGSFDSCLDRYPGDEYVDVIGVNWFGDESLDSRNQLIRFAAECVCFAASRGKVPALTEIGYEKTKGKNGLAHCDDPNWLRIGLIDPLRSHPDAARVAFISFWRNEAYNPSVYHLPPPGSIHSACLAELADDPWLVLGDRVSDLYKHGETVEAISKKVA